MGIRGTLSAIALGATLGAANAAAAGAATDRLCQLIDQAPTLLSFQRSPELMGALLDPTNPCHEAAVGKWNELLGPPGTTGSVGGGYGFV